MSYFYPDSNKWSKIERSYALVSNKCTRTSWKITFNMTKNKCRQWLVTAQNYKALNPIDSWTKSVSSGRATRERPVFVHARPTLPSCASALPQELGWFCSQNFRLSSGIAFGSVYQMVGRGSNFGSKWTLPPDQWVVEVLSASKSKPSGQVPFL